MTVSGRDRVWRAAIELAQSRNYSFRARDVAGKLDDRPDPPSQRTIRRALRAMSELGVLEHNRGSPRYRAGELLEDD